MLIIFVESWQTDFLIYECFNQWLVLNTSVLVWQPSSAFLYGKLPVFENHVIFLIRLQGKFIVTMYDNGHRSDSCTNCIFLVYSNWLWIQCRVHVINVKFEAQYLWLILRVPFKSQPDSRLHCSLPCQPDYSCLWLIGIHTHHNLADLALVAGASFLLNHCFGSIYICCKTFGASTVLWRKVSSLQGHWFYNTLMPNISVSRFFLYNSIIIKYVTEFKVKSFCNILWNLWLRP